MHHVGRRTLRHGDQVLQPLGDPTLHADEPVPARHRELALASGGRELDASVGGDRVVHRRDDRKAAAPDAQDARAERLVVVQDVELAGAAAQLAGQPAAERAWLGKAARAHGAEFQHVGQIAEFAQPRGAERVVVAVEVQAGQPGQPDALIQHRVGLPGEDLDLMAQGAQLAREVPDVDALSAGMRLAAVRRQRDAHHLAGSLTTTGAES